MGLDDVRRNWEAFGEQDPMWAILTGADKSNGRWDTDGFFATGESQAAEFIARLDELGLAHQGRMLDFGCGIGRMTQAFAPSFAECVGVDIAQSMVTRARAANRHGDRVQYVVNDTGNLAQFDDQSFDFVFSYLVLQHMAPEIAVGYVREFFRIAAVGATLVLQLPTHVDPVPLPAEAFRAELTIRAPDVMPAGATAPVEVVVRNASPVTWAAGIDPGVNIGNHWRKRGFRRSVVAFDDARAALQTDVGPGDSQVQTLLVRAPEKPGTYVLEVDMVQELVDWFATRGSPTATASVKVTEPTGGRSVPEPVMSEPVVPEPVMPEPVMEVHGIEKDDVLALVAGCGGSVVAADRNPDARPWESFTYFVTKTTHVSS